MDRNIFFELASGFWLNLAAYYFVTATVNITVSFSSAIVPITYFFACSALSYFSKKRQ